MSGSIEVDYLVIGAGAAGLAFVDALIAESDTTVLTSAWVVREGRLASHPNPAPWTSTRA